MGIEPNNKSASKTAFVFPGQGAQSVGMGQELYRHSKAAKDVFDEIDEILGIRLTRIIFEGPESELEKTVNSQPAIMATSLACLRATDEFHQTDTFKPEFLAGHSLGEYTSLVVSGALDMAEGIRLVRERGRLMQETSERRPGGMVAILGLDEDTVADICIETGAEIANINGTDQIVISGDKICVARAADMASIRGARKAVPLAVAGAFHSSLMAPAQEGLAEAIEQVDFRDPSIPIIANSTSEPMTTASQVQEELRVQLCSCVQWKKSVDQMINTGVGSFIEFGPGRVLGGLIKRISSVSEHGDRQVSIMNVADLPSAMKVAEAVAV